MFDIGPEKLLMLFAVAAVFLGPKELPAAVRTVRATMLKVRSFQDTIRTELSSAIDLPGLLGEKEPVVDHPTDETGGTIT